MSNKIGALPIGLAQNVKLRNSVRKDEIIKISDVDLIEVDDIIVLSEDEASSYLRNFIYVK